MEKIKQNDIDVSLSEDRNMCYIDKSNIKFGFYFTHHGVRSLIEQLKNILELMENKNVIL